MRPHNVFIMDSNPETLHFMVKSSSRNEFHDVYINRDNGMVCTCEQYYYRKQVCKHMIQVKKFMDDMNNVVQKSRTYEGLRV